MTSRITMPEQVLSRYQEGRITSHGLVLDILSQSGKRRLSKILEILPANILRELKEFVESYSTDSMVFRGPRPKARAHLASQAGV